MRSILGKRLFSKSKKNVKRALAVFLALCMQMNTVASAAAATAAPGGPGTAAQETAVNTAEVKKHFRQSPSVEIDLSEEALYAAAKASKSRARMAFQQASAAAARASTLGFVISFPSTTEQPGRRGNMGIMHRWLSSHFRTASSRQDSIFSGQNRPL